MTGTSYNKNRDSACGCFTSGVTSAKSGDCASGPGSALKEPRTVWARFRFASMANSIRSVQTDRSSCEHRGLDEPGSASPSPFDADAEQSPGAWLGKNVDSCAGLGGALGAVRRASCLHGRGRAPCRSCFLVRLRRLEKLACARFAARASLRTARLRRDRSQTDHRQPVYAPLRHSSSCGLATDELAHTERG